MSCSPLLPGDMWRAAGRPQARRRTEGRRRRRARWLAPLLLAAVAAAGIGLQRSGVADCFDVRRIETGPYRHTERAELEARLSRALGRSIWGGVARELESQLQSLPWVRRVVVSRHLPDRLLVQLEEWRPMLLVAGPAAADGTVPTWLLRGDGRVLPAPAGRPAPDLPWLLGAEMAPAPDGIGWRLAERQAAAVLELLAAVAATGLEEAAPIDFLLAGAEGLSLVLQGNRGRLLLGRADYEARLQRYLAVRGELAAGVEVDLRFARSVFVKEPAAAPAADKA